MKRKRAIKTNDTMKSPRWDTYLAEVSGRIFERMIVKESEHYSDRIPEKKIQALADHAIGYASIMLWRLQDQEVIGEGV